MQPRETDLQLPDASVDGRVARGERTRRSIVEALIELLVEGEVRPTARMIAARAGVSVRSIFQHFDDLEGLYGDVVRAQSVRVQPLLDSLECSGGVTRRIDALVEQRAALFEAITPVRHAVGNRAGESEVIAARLREVGEALHRQVTDQFAAELTGPDRDAVAFAVDSMCSFATWDGLRHHHGLSVEQASSTVRVALHRLLV